MSTTIHHQRPDSRWTSALPSAEASARPVSAAAIRLIDLTVSLWILVFFAWLFALIALAVRLDSRGPAIFRQRRVGWRGRGFTVYKFRTMHAHADEDIHVAYMRTVLTTGEQSLGERQLYKLVDDRVTHLGKVLRKTSLDELPQLWNVVRGEMSLVGPRPVVEYEAELYPDWYHERFGVKPGLTGLWQVNGRGRLTYEEMVMLDIEFASRLSLGLYLVILARTIPALLLRIETA